MEIWLKLSRVYYSKPAINVPAYSPILWEFPRDSQICYHGNTLKKIGLTTFARPEVLLSVLSSVYIDIGI